MHLVNYETYILYKIDNPFREKRIWAFFFFFSVEIFEFWECYSIVILCVYFYTKLYLLKFMSIQRFLHLFLLKLVDELVQIELIVIIATSISPESKLIEIKSLWFKLIW